MKRSFLWSLLLGVSLSSLAWAQDEVLKSLTVEQAEKLLKDRKYTYKKNLPDKKGPVVFDFKKDDIALAFYLFADGKDIMLDALLPAIPLEAINQWNVAAKFSRACIRREGTQLASVLESNLDLQGGVTMAAIERFFDTFENDVKAFRQHASRGFKEEPLISSITEQQLEKMFARLGFKTTKSATKDGVIFDYEMQGRKVKLTSVAGTELFLDAVFPVVPLEKANRYNLAKKFIRAVVLKNEGEAYTSLQASLDLTGGVTETIVLHFLGSFEIEIEDFSSFSKKLDKK